VCLFYFYNYKYSGMKKIIAITASCFFAAFYCPAQSQLPIATNLKKTYDKGTRNIDGRPGVHYWQNAANYDINVNFDPASRLLSGTQTITYFNNSPDTLKEIVFKLYPNLYKKGSPRLMKIDDEDAGDGVKIEKLVINSEEQKVNNLRMDATNMSVRVKPLLPHQQLKFEMKYSYTLNKNSHIRTGQVDDGAFFIAYFFPRIAVYDDIDGWNRNPYLGTQEFYNDFCNFKVNINLPGDYMAWATGDLKNCSDVFNEKYCNRITQAATGDGFVDIIDSTDLQQGNITKNTAGNNWQFEADNVPDFAFAISNHYLWQSSSLVVDKSTDRRTRVDAVFNKEHKDYFHVIGDNRKTVEAMSYRFPKWPFPYSHETVFDGLDQMEYPMMVNDNPVEDRAESIELTDHEVFHTMFPFYTGLNETKYGWMDEGWATIGEWLISPMIDPSLVDEYGMAAVNQTAGTEVDLPITTLTTQLNGTSMFINSYPKPALGYLYAKDMLGDDLFYKGLHTYFRNWNSKHPMPYDFFNSMNTGSGKNLNWFWKKWFFDDGIPDLAIASVKGKLITVESKGEKPVPIDLLVTFKDGSTEKIHRSVAVWEKGNKTVAVPASKNNITKVVMGSTYNADKNKADNTWEITK
jgi:hypothetical protein